jgi:signal transduction histidine kinase
MWRWTSMSASAAVGGNVYSVGTHGQQTADIGLRILRGRATLVHSRSSRSPPSRTCSTGASCSAGASTNGACPAGSVVDFRAPTLWGLYKWPFTLGVTLFLLQNAAGRRTARESDAAPPAPRRKCTGRRDELAHAQRVATLGELTASIAHELRQPLTAITRQTVQAARKMLAVDHARQDIDEALADVGSEAAGPPKLLRGLRGPVPQRARDASTGGPERAARRRAAPS